MLDGIELKWTLDARYDKSTIPMARLAEYLAEYAALLGEGASVHLDRVETGSVVLTARIEREAKAEVLARCRLAGNDNAPASLQKHYLKIAEMARDDGGKAFIERGNRKILRFKLAADRAPVHFRGGVTFVGKLMRGGQLKNGSYKATVGVSEGYDDRMVAVYVDAGSKEQIKDLLFDTVRVNGNADWHRSAFGEWTFDNVRGADLEAVIESSAGAAFDELSSRDYGWVDDPIGLQNELRRDDA